MLLLLLLLLTTSEDDARGANTSADSADVATVGDVSMDAAAAAAAAVDADDDVDVDMCVLCKDKSRPVPSHYCQMCEAKVHSVCCHELTGVEDTFSCRICWLKRRERG